MSLNSLLGIGETAVTAQRLAMEVTSQNIANVNTAGYSKQRAIMESASVQNSGGFSMEGGVKLVAVERSYDAQLHQQLINGNNTGGKDTSLLNSLIQVEPSFNEVANDGLGKAMSKFFDAWQDLTLNPSGTAERQAVLTRANVLTDTFHQISTSLTNTITVADNDLSGITSEITDKAKNIASLNLQIKTTEQLGGNSNELRDQRDQLLVDLSKKMGFTFSEQADGTVTVNLPLTSAGGGQPLVVGNTWATVYTNSNGTNNDIRITAVGNPPPPTNPATDANVTATIGGPNDVTKAPDNSLGQIGGTLQIRDKVVGGTSGYLAKLNEIANQFVSNVNTQHRAGWVNTLTPGGDFFNPAGTTAATINLAAGFSSDKIAAAYAWSDPPANTVPATITSGNNINARLMADLKAKNTVAFTVGGTTTTASFDSYYNSFVSSVGIDVEAAQNGSDQNDGFIKQLNALRESMAGVSLDEELTNLMKYQRSFQAAAKTISTATEMMDTVMNLIR